MWILKAADIAQLGPGAHKFSCEVTCQKGTIEIVQPARPKENVPQPAGGAAEEEEEDDDDDGADDFDDPRIDGLLNQLKAANAAAKLAAEEDATEEMEDEADFRAQRTKIGNGSQPIS